MRYINGRNGTGRNARPTARTTARIDNGFGDPAERKFEFDGVLVTVFAANPAGDPGLGNAGIGNHGPDTPGCAFVSFRVAHRKGVGRAGLNAVLAEGAFAMGK